MPAAGGLDAGVSGFGPCRRVQPFDAAAESRCDPPPLEPGRAPDGRIPRQRRPVRVFTRGRLYRLPAPVHICAGRMPAPERFARDPRRPPEGRLAQLVEQLTLNQRVRGSSPRSPSRTPVKTMSCRNTAPSDTEFSRLRSIAAGQQRQREIRRSTAQTGANPDFSPQSRPASRPDVRSARSGPKSVAGTTVEARDAAGGRPRIANWGATRRAALSGRHGASSRLPDVPHRAARLSCPAGPTAPRRS